MSRVIRSLFGFLAPRLDYACDELPLVTISLPKNAVILIPPRTHGDAGGILSLSVGDWIKTGGRILDTNGEILAFSPVTGKIEDISPLACIDEVFTAVSVALSDKEETDPQSRGVDGYLDMEPVSIIETLRRAGFRFRVDEKGWDAAVINCLESDILISTQAHILAEYGDLIRRGIRLLRKMAGGTGVIAVRKELRAKAETILTGEGSEIADVEVVKAAYPAGCDEILTSFLRRKIERPLILSPMTLASMVHYLENGHPVFEKIFTLIDRNNQRINIRARIGTPISHILREADINIGAGDKLVLGGSMRGRPAFHAEFPITESIDAVMVQDRNAIVRYENNACTNCGRCVAVCPIRLQVHLLCRYSEFSLFDRCKDFAIDSCIECGLCAYVCPSRRALLQYIMLAKKEIARLERNNAHAST